MAPVPEPSGRSRGLAMTSVVKDYQASLRGGGADEAIQEVSSFWLVVPLDRHGRSRGLAIVCWRLAIMVVSCDEWDALPGVATPGRARVGRPPRDRDIKPAVILVAHPLLAHA